MSNNLPEVLPTRAPDRLRLYVSEGRATFEVSAAQSVVVGRSSSAGSVEVDLSPYNAVDLGISRHHVQFDIVGDRLMVKDLESVNGSSLNGKPLAPNHYYPVTHGDELKIGRLKMRIFFLYD
ncbi:FHA domain-containing protein [Aggregatilineales bacterium SYSU G02658]